jgi:hypothetical protein
MSTKLKTRAFSLTCSHAILLSAVFFISCKGDFAPARLQSLDNFARNSGESSRNVCKGDQKIVMGIHQEWDHVDFTRAPAERVPTLKAALQNSLSAVPSNLQDLYFGLGGKIIFTPNLGKPAVSSAELTCDTSGAKAKFASEGTDRIEACWTIDTKTADVVILMNPTVESVQHATVRIFGYILSQILTKLDVDERDILIAKKNDQFDRLISDIAAAVVADVRKSGSKYTLAVNESLLSSDDFKYFAFAEAFDSFYCNAELRRSMAKADEFPKTFALFKMMDRELQSVQTTDSNTNVAGASSDNGSYREDQDQATFSLGIFGRIFGGLGRVGGFLGRGLFKGVGFLGRGIGNLGRGIFNGGRGIIRGAGRLLGGAAGGLGNLLGGGLGGLAGGAMQEGGGGAGGGIISLIQSLFGS